MPPGCGPPGERRGPISVPLGWFAAFNMTPHRFVYPVARFLTMVARAVHEMIWTIIFVTILGFGMLPGVLALTVFCTGFAAKLFAEEIEAIDMGPVEAVRATGANRLQVFVYGVFPQVRVAFTGIAIYTWDVAFATRARAQADTASEISTRTMMDNRMAATRWVSI